MDYWNVNYSEGDVDEREGNAMDPVWPSQQTYRELSSAKG